MNAREPGEASWPSAARGWSAVLIFCVAALLSYSDRQILSLQVDTIRSDLGITDTQIGLLQGAAFAFTYAFMGVPVGRLADVTVRTRLLMAGIGAWSLGTLVCGLAQSFSVIFAGRMIVGLGEAALAPAGLSMISDLFPPEKRGLATGTFLMGMLAGGGVAIVVGGAVPAAAAAGAFSHLPGIATLAPWRATMVILALCGLVPIALTAFMREPDRRNFGGRIAIPGSGYRQELAQLRFLLVPLIFGCGILAVGDLAIPSWLPALLMRDYGVSTVEIGTKLGSIVIVTGILATLISGYVSDRLRRRFGAQGRIYFTIGAGLLALPGSLFWLVDSADQALLLASWWLFFSTMGGAGGIMTVQDTVSNNLQGLSFSLISFTTILIGLGVGAGLPGLLVDRLFADAHAVGPALTVSILPAGIIASACFSLAAIAASRARHSSLA